MMLDEEEEEKVEEAKELLKDAGFRDFAIIGRGFGACYIDFEIEDEDSFDNLAELQGYISQAQFRINQAQNPNPHCPESGEGDENE